MAGLLLVVEYFYTGKDLNAFLSNYLMPIISNFLFKLQKFILKSQISWIMRNLGPKKRVCSPLKVEKAPPYPTVFLSDR